MCSLTTQCSKYQSLSKNIEVVFKCYTSLISFCQRDPVKLLTIQLVFASAVHASQAHSVTSRKRLINICSLGHATGINLTTAFRKRRNNRCSCRYCTGTKQSYYLQKNYVFEMAVTGILWH